MTRKKAEWQLISNCRWSPTTHHWLMAGQLPIQALFNWQGLKADTKKQLAPQRRWL